MTARRVRAATTYSLRGEITVTVRNARGVILRQLAIRNTITYAGRNAPLYLLAQTVGVPGDRRIATLIPGTDGTPPTVGDLGVVAPIGVGNHITLAPGNFAIDDAAGELVITATLPVGPGSGEILREVGLVLANSELFARQVHPQVTWIAGNSVTYTWRIAATS